MHAALWSIYCLTSESSDTNLSIVMDYNSSRYLFNCGENTTRALLQRRKGFRKFRAILLSGINTDKSSGLPGILMTIADANITKTNIIGPSGLHHFLASTRLYVLRESLTVDTKEVSSTPPSSVYQDENISIFAVPLSPETRSNSPQLKRKEVTVSSPSSSPPRKRKKLEDDKDEDALLLADQNEDQYSKVIRQMFGTATGLVSQAQATGSSPGRRARFPSIFEKSLPRFIRKPQAISYIVVGTQGRGKFDATKATELGLENGPVRARLARGETVVIKDGRTIIPEMVLGPAPQSEVFIFVDCPSPEYIPSLQHSEAFSEYQKNGKYSTHCVVHLVGEGVLEDPRYKAWLETFGKKDIHHLFAGSHITPDRICFTSTAYAQLRLSHLDNNMFPIPKYLPVINPSSDSSITLLRHGHSIPMKPKSPPVLPPDNDGIDLFHPAIEGGGVDDISSFLKPKTITAYQHAQSLVKENQVHRVSRPGDDITIIPFGTSSAMPSKYRNVSSLLIHFPDSRGILLDCGEGTFGQLHRQFGTATPTVLRNIQCIFISHIHADHHMGLSKLLSKRRKATVMYLREYSDLEDLGLDDSLSGVKIIPAESIQEKLYHNYDSVEVQRDLQDLEVKLDLAYIRSVNVPHRGRCFGLVIKHKEGWSIVYSGDTKPSEKLIRAGRHATLLIHEATLGDDQKEMAEAKGHSTIGQAIEVGKRMQAQNILLTHFSNRFPKTPQLISGEPDPNSPTIAIAFDGSPIRIGDMWKATYYLPAIEQSFLDSEDPVDEEPEKEIRSELE
ncbi:hypothetical protein Clacol_010417 [Clathrus columnatus]|uniref:ribonuclease Z n=1 Tax=Clathrus columnatus TaxID=1419009 RepID=A0AAV5AQU4_9AGAM|nr:hypothetical protein Clacol_010417 [Clathrus columnatus]